ncbi:MAG: sarcosine oxidase subunit alpha family protein, partial [Pseudomonadota bacterium]
EPNALMRIGTGASATPNVRSTVQELYDGLRAETQNAWPSVGLDLLEVNDLLSPFLAAGFYYKTFMWPRNFWEKVYEPLIRRAAGLGAIPGKPDPDRHDKAFAHCDLLVIGGGPAGLMAALVAGRAGADVILADEDNRFGGRLLAETHELDGKSGVDWADGVAAELTAMPNVRLMRRTTVTGAYDGGVFGALERVSHHLNAPAEGAPIETFWRITSRRAILAAGALERPIAFPNNDRPGVMLASAVRAYANRWAVSPGSRIAVFGNNDDAHRTAHDLSAAGVEVAAMIDTRDGIDAKGDFPVISGAQITGVTGRMGVRKIRVEGKGATQHIACDAVAVSGGWNPTVHMTSHMGGRLVWRDDIAAFVPRENAVPGLVAVGSATGAYSTAEVLRSAVSTAENLLKDQGFSPSKTDLPVAEDGPVSVAAFWMTKGSGRAWLDFQNDVTTKDIKQAAAENMSSVEHMKRYTTQGMATDQGKNSNVGALAILADSTGRSIPETGTTTFRPPFVPVSLGSLGAGAQGTGFAPERLTTSHRASLARSAPMIAVGLWYRPSYFPAPGESHWRESCDREVGYVRNAVGIAEVSTLGKIDLKGPDAAAFLDFVYANTFSTLKVGRTRYGLMLREDGFVMDDGTTARLGDQHFLMTTTTAAAGQVMQHLEFVHQCLRPDMDVRFVSVTDHWAQFAVAGPRSRDLLNSVLDQPIDDNGFPFMGCAPVSVLGTPGRLFRISFSGEHAYEIAVPARYGDGLFRDLVARAEALGGGAYGMEALNVLRLEKGFITHAEIDGRVTADDVGLGRMVSTKKDCIGRAATTRPALSDPERAQMVGLRPIDPKKKIDAGGHLFARGDKPVRVNHQGYVTSTCWSPTLGTYLALGFLKRGRARIGEVVQFVDHMRGVRAEVEVTDPIAFDPDGGRARG